MKRKPKQTGDGTFINSIISAIRDIRQAQAPEVSPVPDDLRIDGKTCLVTGANSGLGKAAAVELAARGGNMILACRPGHLETSDEIKRLSGSGYVFQIRKASMASVQPQTDGAKGRHGRAECYRDRRLSQFPWL